MYDFLCLLPHAAASHSLIHYLNQHPGMHVASYATVSRSLDDVLAYQRYLRPYVSPIGVATKDYDTPDIVAAILAATKRDLVIQTVRDPVECFVAQVNNELFSDKFRKFTGNASRLPTLEEMIVDALTRYITPAAAEVAYEVDSFKEHIIVDVNELKSDCAEATVRRLWRRLCCDPGALPAAGTCSFHPIGARQFGQLRTFGGVNILLADRKISFFAVPEGDLWLGYFDAQKNLYSSQEVFVHTFPDATALLPSLRLKGALHVAVSPHAWYALHPKIRQPILEQALELLTKRMPLIDVAFRKGEVAMTFTLESMSAGQKDMLKKGLEEDFTAFRRRHPAVAERWTVTRAFLGL